MRVEFTPTVKTQEKITKIVQLRQEGKTWYEIAKIMGHGRDYVMALYRYWKDQKGVK